MVGHHGALRRKALGMLCLLLQVGDGDEQREVGVRVAGALELGVHLLLNELPDGVAPRFDDHAAAHLGVLRHVGSLDDLLVPLREVLRAGGRNCILLCHIRLIDWVIF